MAGAGRDGFQIQDITNAPMNCETNQRIITNTTTTTTTNSTIITSNNQHEEQRFRNQSVINIMLNSRQQQQQQQQDSSRITNNIDNKIIVGDQRQQHHHHHHHDTTRSPAYDEYHHGTRRLSLKRSSQTMAPTLDPSGYQVNSKMAKRTCLDVNNINDRLNGLNASCSHPNDANSDVGPLVLNMKTAAEHTEKGSYSAVGHLSALHRDQSKASEELQQQPRAELPMAIHSKHLVRTIADLPVFVTIEGYRIASYFIAGEPHLCLPQLLQYIKQDFPLDKAIDTFEETVTYFATATPKQLEGFIKASVLPPDAKSCPLIRRSDADRVCLRLFDQCRRSGRSNNDIVNFCTKTNQTSLANKESTINPCGGTDLIAKTRSIGKSSEQRIDLIDKDEALKSTPQSGSAEVSGISHEDLDGHRGGDNLETCNSNGGNRNNDDSQDSVEISLRIGNSFDSEESRPSGLTHSSTATNPQTSNESTKSETNHCDPIISNKMDHDDKPSTVQPYDDDKRRTSDSSNISNISCSSGRNSNSSCNHRDSSNSVDCSNHSNRVDASSGSDTHGSPKSENNTMKGHDQKITGRIVSPPLATKNIEIKPDGGNSIGKGDQVSDSKMSSIKREHLFEYEVQNPILDLARAVTSTLKIQVYHRCFGKCIGLFYPSLLVDSESDCIECSTCHLMLSSRRFVGHTHGIKELNVCHWGFNSYNWRHYIRLSRKQTMNNLADDELLRKFEILQSIRDPNETSSETYQSHLTHNSEDQDKVSTLMNGHSFHGSNVNENHCEQAKNVAADLKNKSPSLEGVTKQHYNRPPPIVCQPVSEDNHLPAHIAFQKPTPKNRRQEQNPLLDPKLLQPFMTSLYGLGRGLCSSGVISSSMSPPITNASSHSSISNTDFLVPLLSGHTLPATQQQLQAFIARNYYETRLRGSDMAQMKSLDSQKRVSPLPPPPPPPPPPLLPQTLLPPSTPTLSSSSLSSTPSSSSSAAALLNKPISHLISEASMNLGSAANYHLPLAATSVAAGAASKPGPSPTNDPSTYEAAAAAAAIMTHPLNGMTSKATIDNRELYVSTNLTTYLRSKGIDLDLARDIVDNTLDLVNKAKILF